MRDKYLTVRVIKLSPTLNFNAQGKRDERARDVTGSTKIRPYRVFKYAVW